MSLTRITVLVENTVHRPGLLAEHGLSYWIEAGDRRVLFDTGQGSVLAGNAYKLGVPLRQAEAVVLSHGHFDHTGGLAEVLKQGPSMAVYLHPAALEPKFARNDNGTAREIGMPAPAQAALDQRAPRPVFTTEPTPVAGGLTATGPVPRTTDFEDTGGPFFLDRDTRRPDPLADDQSLFFDTSQGTVVLLGCAHSGVINTLRYVQSLTGARPIHAVVGGMHLVRASAERLARTVEEFRRLNVAILAPAHCTGMAATVGLWQALGPKCRVCNVATRFEFETA